MKQIRFIWRDPAGSLVDERFDLDRYKFEVENGIIYVHDQRQKADALTLAIPVRKFEMYQLIDTPDEKKP